MARLLAVLILLVLQACLAQATMYGFYSSGAGLIQFCKLDPTGSRSPIGGQLAVEAGLGAAVVDPAGKTYHFLGTNSTDNTVRLFGIALADGSLTSSVVVKGVTSPYAYTMAFATIGGKSVLNLMAKTDVFTLFRVDPATGKVVEPKIFSLTGAYGPINCNGYISLPSGDLIITATVGTTDTPLVLAISPTGHATSYPNPYAMSHMGYDAKSGKVVGVAYDSTNNTHAFAILNPATGKIAVTDLATQYPYVECHGSVFDPDTRLLYAYLLRGQSEAPELVAIEVESGKVKSAVTVGSNVVQCLVFV